MKAKHVVDVEIVVGQWSYLFNPTNFSDDIRGYRIWLMKDVEFGRIWQCHEWEYARGNGERKFDKWIPSYLSWRKGGFPENYQSPQPNEQSPLQKN